MTIEEAIKKAIEGGWRSKNTINGTMIKASTVEAELAVNGTMSLAWFLDPAFWQSLGKSMGWDDEEGLRRWRYEWHDFIDDLANGKSAETYFETLS